MFNFKLIAFNIDQSQLEKLPTLASLLADYDADRDVSVDDLRLAGVPVAKPSFARDPDIIFEAIRSVLQKQEKAAQLAEIKIKVAIRVAKAKLPALYLQKPMEPRLLWDFVQLLNNPQNLAGKEISAGSLTLKITQATKEAFSFHIQGAEIVCQGGQYSWQVFGTITENGIRVTTNPITSDRNLGLPFPKTRDFDPNENAATISWRETPFASSQRERTIGPINLRAICETLIERFIEEGVEIGVFND
ncbi:MAG: hypothetical protein HQ596_01915 [Candidatus Saganbacteria bacterium]|nr:hypothetical protein [Candidatus Saganbacteria bacterium]